MCASKISRLFGDTVSIAALEYRRIAQANCSTSDDARLRLRARRGWYHTCRTGRSQIPCRCVVGQRSKKLCYRICVCLGAAPIFWSLSAPRSSRHLRLPMQCSGGEWPISSPALAAAEDEIHRAVGQGT